MHVGRAGQPLPAARNIVTRSNCSRSEDEVINKRLQEKYKALKRTRQFS